MRVVAALAVAGMLRHICVCRVHTRPVAHTTNLRLQCQPAPAAQPLPETTRPLYGEWQLSMRWSWIDCVPECAFAAVLDMRV